MRELFKKIFGHIISREEDTYQMDKRLGDWRNISRAIRGVSPKRIWKHCGTVYIMPFCLQRKNPFILA